MSEHKTFKLVSFNNVFEEGCRGKAGRRALGPVGQACSLLPTKQKGGGRGGTSTRYDRLVVALSKKTKKTTTPSNVVTRTTLLGWFTRTL